MTSTATFEVSTGAALRFLRLRSWCTGLNSLSQVAEKSGLAMDETEALLRWLEPAGVVRWSAGDAAPEDPCEILARACSLWNDEHRIASLGSALASGAVTEPVMRGWLLERYHLAADFPAAVEHGARRADGGLRGLLLDVAAQERGREKPVWQALEGLGVSKTELACSIPLLSTRLVGFLLRELFELEPWSVLMVLAVTEPRASAGDPGDAAEGPLAPYLHDLEAHASLGHAGLLEAHGELITVDDTHRVDAVVNKVHDLMHAFDLQGQEVTSYYASLDGKYFPRQAVNLASI
jgi:hypothetical protein